MFPSASQARTLAPKTILPILAEIRHVEIEVMYAIDDGKLECFVSNSPMTMGGQGDCLPVRYWKVWREQMEDRALEMHMNDVEKYFRDLGYSIVRKQSPSNPQTFYWHIQW
jgi:hypothetical protein